MLILCGPGTYYAPVNTTLRVTCFFFFNATATTEIYTSLHDALPILRRRAAGSPGVPPGAGPAAPGGAAQRSEEHTSELQSHSDLVCRLLLEKKKKDIDAAKYTPNTCVTTTETKKELCVQTAPITDRA